MRVGYTRRRSQVNRARPWSAMLESSRVQVPKRWGIVRMFWRRRQRETLEGSSERPGPLADPPQAPASQPLAETIEVERDASRAACISRVAEELRQRGEEVVELFEEISSSTGWETVMPIHLRRGGEDVFVEVETGPWEEETVESGLKAAAGRGGAGAARGGQRPWRACGGRRRYSVGRSTRTRLSRYSGLTLCRPRYAISAGARRQSVFNSTSFYTMTRRTPGPALRVSKQPPNGIGA